MDTLYVECIKFPETLQVRKNEILLLQPVQEAASKAVIRDATSDKMKIDWIGDCAQ